MDWTDNDNSQPLAVRSPPHPQTRVPISCLGSAEWLPWPGQAPRLVSMSILLRAHGSRCPQALGPEQDPGAPGSLGPQPCRDRKGIRRPGGDAAALLEWVTTEGMESWLSKQGGSRGRPEEGAQRGQKWGLQGSRGELAGTVSATPPRYET